MSRSVRQGIFTTGSLIVTVLVALLLLPAVSSAAPPPLLSKFCLAGEGGGRCGESLSSIAANPVTGDVYVADSANARISQFTVWGQFIRAFGGGVVNGGATGTGTLTPGSTTVESVSAATKAFIPGTAIEAQGLAAGTIVTSLGRNTITLSKPANAAATGAPTTLTSPEAAGNVPVNELQRISVTATGGAFKLRFTTSEPDSAQATTANLTDNASAAQVQSALEGLSTIGPGNIAVTSPNPGGETGVPGGPYTIEFKGPRFADTDVQRMELVASLSGGGAGVEILRNGASAVEVCTGLDCRVGVEGNRAGQFFGAKGITIDSNGDLYVYETTSGWQESSLCPEERCFQGNNRVQKFDSEGSFLLMFGGGVNEGGGTPSNPGNLCTAADISNGDVCGGGKRGAGSGEFGIGGGEAKLEPLGNYIAAGPGDTIYVGGLERIQEFNSDGTFKGLLPDPDGVLAGEPVQSLAVDLTGGNFYVSVAGKGNVSKLSPAGKSLMTLTVNKPRALAVDSAGNLYVVDGQKMIDGTELEVRKFTSAGAEVPGFTFHDGLASSIGIATSSACGIPGTDLYIRDSAGADSSVRAYGPPPNPTVCPPPSVPPTISDQYAVSAGSDGATLKAEINPNFWPDATYYVEYGTGRCSEGGCGQQQPLAPGSKLTATTTNQVITTAGVFLHGLAPSTTYHYRFVAQSGGGGPVGGVGGADGSEKTFTTFALTPQPNADCANQAFRTGPSARLADCRAYEMVSPVDKNNGDIATPDTSIDVVVGGRINRSRIVQATPEGEKITYSARSAFAGALAGAWSNQYLASRDPQAGWSTQAISPPRTPETLAYEFSSETPFRAFSEDLCSAWVFDESGYELAPGAPAGVPNLYRRDLCREAGYEVLSSVPPPGYGPSDGINSKYWPVPQALIDGGARTIFHAPARLTERACPTKGVTQLYETTEGGPLRLISALPNGNGTCSNASVGTSGGRSLSNFHGDTVAHAVSKDGSRVFWTESSVDLNHENDGSPGTIYLRTNPEQPQSAIAAGKCTQPARACTVKVSEKDSVFLSADPNGSHLIYKTDEKLYEAEIEEEGGQLVSHPALIAEGVQGIIGTNDDATRIFLVSTEALAAGSKEGKLNLYLYEKGAGFRFVVRLADIDGTGRSGARADLGGLLSPFHSNPYHRSSRVSADGLHTTFMSRGSLTGYDNTDLSSGEPDAEVYVYDATAEGGAGKLSCASCNPSEARPRGRETGFIGTGNTFWTAAAIPGWETQFQPSRAFSANGSRLFFESFEALVLADTNGKTDVYQWEASGSGDCTQQSGSFSQNANGCVSLITSGESPEDSELLDASANGRDVFFTTSESLLPQDPGLVDIYDARAGGGYPPLPTPPPACEGEACQGPLAPPNDPTPGSSSFQGAGNVVEKPAKKKAKKKHAKKKHKAKKRANHKRKAAR
jgi:hypothetical protein